MGCVERVSVRERKNISENVEQYIEPVTIKCKINKRKGETIMREVTVKEFVKAFEGKKVCIESVDSYGIMLSMANAHIEYREEENELVLGGGDYNHGGNAFVSLNVEDTIEAIEEDEGVYTISFIPYMSDVTVEEELPLEELQN